MRLYPVASHFICCKRLQCSASVPSSSGSSSCNYPYHPNSHATVTRFLSTTPTTDEELPSSIQLKSFQEDRARFKDAIHRLASLNGYHPIPIARHQVPLAEGVLAEASKTVHEDYTVYRKPSVASTATAKSPTKSIDKHPSFREEDFSLFRIVQTSVEQSLNRREEQIRLHLLKQQEQVQQSYSKLVETIYTPLQNLMGNNSRNCDGKGGELPNSPSLEATQDESLSMYGNEDLLILYDKGHRLLLVQDVPPKYRLLVLPTTPTTKNPYRLQHGRAASVIYTGLVMGSGVPLAYRSLKYAFDYPGLAQVMVASVVGSVSYSLWASRNGAQTRQLLVVANATTSRIVARDEAAMLLLREGARRRSSDNIVGDGNGNLAAGH
jgi:hypothetical protein